jgi:vacuolar protein sorting-associated protein 13D
VFRTENPLQAEIHYRMAQRGSNLTIVLNNMRLMVILEWWMEVRHFLTQEIPRPPGLNIIDNEATLFFERNKNVSTGIVTRRAPVLDVPDSIFELKINISNCELVVVEKTSIWDTNALILKVFILLFYT